MDPLCGLVRWDSFTARVFPAFRSFFFNLFPVIEFNPKA